MIWLTWRQFRVQAAAVYAAIAAVAVYLAITGPRLVHLAQLDGSIFDKLTRSDRNLFAAGVVVLAVAPAVIGAFWGAPMVARELEAGTHRLVWNQSITRTRWLATKLGVTTLSAAVAVGALTLAVSWWSDPIDGALSSTHGSLPARMTPVTFAMRGIAPVGYTVFAVVLGVTFGVLIRKSLLAMALTLAVFAFVQIAMPLWVRPHLVAPVEKLVTMSRSTLDGIMIDEKGDVRLSARTGAKGAWVLTNQTVDADGNPSALPSWMSTCLPRPPAPDAAGAEVTKAEGPSDLEACFTRLTAEGYRQRVVYQPAGHFWAVQWLETVLFLAVAGVLAGFCFWWTRHRLS
jgi:ABC-type transport system involved in multi-copper enzyme maturation permease subunit